LTLTFARGRKTNLVDQMLVMVRKYTDNLEDLVEERTQQLKDEQKKTEDLLCRLLPR
jgi:atrial natriuretic peptide receptor A